MPQVVDGDGGAAFAFVVPVQPTWVGNLATITLSGPGGSATLDGDSNRPMAILRDSLTGQVRGILDAPAQADGAVASAYSGLEMVFSRGIPDVAAWRR